MLLISVLFMSSVMLPIFIPEEVAIDKLLRAIICIIFFESAYMAEVIRGGLQAIPRGQYEAAEALGFSVEGYVFTALIYWIACFSMSRYSQYLERKLHTGH